MNDLYDDVSEVTEDEVACRICGCTESDACVTRTGACAWAEPDLCTACAAAPFPNLRAAGFAY
jgi:hypothetical protein